MCAMAKAGAREIDCWLTEGRRYQCRCDKCLGAGENMHYALETRAYVNGWRIARKQYPKLFVRIVLTQGTYTSNDKVLAEVPQDVGVIFYASWATYNSLQKPMIYPLLEDFAAKGDRLRQPLGDFGCAKRRERRAQDGFRMSAMPGAVAEADGEVQPLARQVDAIIVGHDPQIDMRAGPRAPLRRPASA